MVPVVVHLAKVGRENAGGLVPDLARQTSLPRMARTDAEDLVRQVASRDPLSFHERAAKHLVHVGGDLLGSARALFAHRDVDDVRKDACMDEQLAVVEVGSLHDQPGVSLRVQRRLPDFRPESVPEGLLSALTAFPVHVEIVVAQRPHDPSPEPVRLTGEAMDEVEDLLQMSSVAHVSGEHESPLARGPVVGRIDEAERAKNLLQRLQLAVNVPDDAHPLRAVLEKLRDVAMRGESRLDRHVLHDDVLHLKDVELVRSEADRRSHVGRGPRRSGRTSPR